MVSQDFTVYNTEITLALPKLEITFVLAIFSVVYMGFSFWVNNEQKPKTRFRLRGDTWPWANFPMNKFMGQIFGGGVTF